MNVGAIVGISIAAVVLLVLIIFAASYVKAPPDTAVIITGPRKQKVLIGKAGIRVPLKYSLQGTTQSRYLTGGVPPVRFSM